MGLMGGEVIVFTSLGWGEKEFGGLGFYFSYILYFLFAVYNLAFGDLEL
jgi:hypothetical protein